MSWCRYADYIFLNSVYHLKFFNCSLNQSKATIQPVGRQLESRSYGGLAMTETCLAKWLRISYQNSGRGPRIQSFSTHQLASVNIHYLLSIAQPHDWPIIGRKHPMTVDPNWPCMLFLPCNTYISPGNSGSHLRKCIRDMFCPTTPRHNLSQICWNAA